MGANDVGKVIVGTPASTGGILVAPTGTKLPTDAVMAPDVAFIKLGYISDDGVTKGAKRDTDTVNEWGGSTLAVVQKDFTATFKFALTQILDPEAHKLLWGDSNVTVTAATAAHGNQVAVQETADVPPHKSYIFEVLNGIKKVRYVVPDGQVSDQDDTDLKNDDVIKNGVTITCFPDADGVCVYTYTDDGKKTSGS